MDVVLSHIVKRFGAIAANDDVTVHFAAGRIHGQQGFPQGPRIDDVVGRQSLEQPFVLALDGPAAAAGADDGRNAQSLGEDPAPDIGDGGQRHQDIGPVGLESAPQGGQGRKPDGRLAGKPEQGNAGRLGVGGEVPHGGEHPEFRGEAGTVKAFGQLQGLALRAAKRQILKQHDHAGGAGLVRH